MSRTRAASHKWHSALMVARSGIPEEHYERDWPNRFGLNDIGRRGLGLPVPGT